MRQTKIIDAQFIRLTREASDLAATVRPATSPHSLATNTLDFASFLGWKAKVSHLLEAVCGESSQHLTRFNNAEKVSAAHGHVAALRDTTAILLAAKEDYENGMFVSMRSLIVAEVFDSELEQAEELHSHGYATAAAVTAGIVLETTIRRLCQENNLGLGKLETMNAELAKAEVYNKLVQKQVTAWAGVRNNAAHGKEGEFSREDVSALIAGVRNFVAGHLP